MAESLTLPSVCLCCRSPAEMQLRALVQLHTHRTLLPTTMSGVFLSAKKAVTDVIAADCSLGSLIACGTGKGVMAGGARPKLG
jgi:hypothetical protein